MKKKNYTYIEGNIHFHIKMRQNVRFTLFSAELWEV